MKLLLDENIPRKIKNDLSNHLVFTVQDMGRNGKENGELLKLMIENNFDAFVTADKNLQNQQNFNTYPIPVLVLHTFRITYKELQTLIPTIVDLLKLDLPPGATVVSPQSK